MDDRLNNFVAFLHDAGIQFDDQAIRFVKSQLQGYGVVACEDIAVGKIIATVPKTAILSVETAALWCDINKRKPHDDGEGDDDDDGDDEDDADSDAHPRDNFCPPMLQLPAAVLFETLLGAKSLWYHYLNVLPTSLSEIGVVLGEKEDTAKELFQGTGIDILVVRTRTNLKTVFQSSVQQLFQQRARELGISADVVARVTWQEFALAYAWVTSRAFQVDEVHGNSMVPVADMFNHSTDREHVHIEGGLDSKNEDSDEDEEDDEDASGDGGDGDDGNAEVNGNGGGNEEGASDHLSSSKPDGDGQNSRPDDQLAESRDELNIVCVRKVKSREEVFNTFGQKCNTVLFLNYGFTEAHNMYDTAFLHREDVDDVLKQFCKENVSTERRMRSERQACIDAASLLIYDDVTDDFFQIVTDGTFCHGLLLLAYLHVVPWAIIAPLYNDELELLDHLMQLSIHEIMDAGRAQIVGIVKSIVQRIEGKYPDGCSIASDKDLLGHKNVSPVRKHALRIRLGQRKALKVACEKLYSQADDLDEANDGNFSEGERWYVERVRKKAKAV